VTHLLYTRMTRPSRSAHVSLCHAAPETPALLPRLIVVVSFLLMLVPRRCDKVPLWELLLTSPPLSSPEPDIPRALPDYPVPLFSHDSPRT